MSLPSPLDSSWSPLLLIGFLLKKSVFLALKCWNCLLNLAASCLDDENEIPLKVIGSFSAVNSFGSSTQLGKICLLVYVLNKISHFSPFMLTDAFLDVFIQS